MRTSCVLPILFLSTGFGQILDSSSPVLDRQEQARGILEDSLKDRNPDSRKQAVQALSLLDPQEPYLTELEAMLDDKDVEVRLATITSLMDLRNKRTVLALQKALESDV